MKLADRRGNIEECSSGQDRLLEWIYTHETGRFLMKGPVSYTHLDVYKRQSWKRDFCLCRFIRQAEGFLFLAIHTYLWYNNLDCGQVCIPETTEKYIESFRCFFQ